MHRDQGLDSGRQPGGKVSPADGLRLPDTESIQRGPRLRIAFDGLPIAAHAGETVAAALFAAGRLLWRTTPRRGEPRGLYCGIGVCYECLVEIDGVTDCRACLTEVRDGMRVTSQRPWPPEAGSSVPNRRDS